MKSKVLLICSKLAFVLAGAQFAWSILAILASLGHTSAFPTEGVLEIMETDTQGFDIFYRSAPYLLLFLLCGLGFYLRWLSKRFWKIQ